MKDLLVKGIHPEEYKRNTNGMAEAGMCDWEQHGFTFNYVHVKGGAYQTGVPGAKVRSLCYLDDFYILDAAVSVSDWENFRTTKELILKSHPKFKKNFRQTSIEGTPLGKDNHFDPIISISVQEVWEFANYVTWFQAKNFGRKDEQIELPYLMLADDKVETVYKIPGAYYVASEWQLEYLVKGGMKHQDYAATSGAPADIEFAFTNPDVIVTDEKGQEQVADGKLLHPHLTAYDHTGTYGESIYKKIHKPVSIRPEYGYKKKEPEVSYQPNIYGIYHLCGNVLIYCSNLFHEKELPLAFVDKYTDVPAAMGNWAKISDWEGF